MSQLIDPFLWQSSSDFLYCTHIQSSTIHSVTGSFAFNTTFNHGYCFHESFVHSQFTGEHYKFLGGKGGKNPNMQGYPEGCLKFQAHNLLASPKAQGLWVLCLSPHSPTHTTDGLLHPALWAHNVSTDSSSGNTISIMCSLRWLCSFCNFVISEKSNAIVLYVCPHSKSKRCCALQDHTPTPLFWQKTFPVMSQSFGSPSPAISPVITASCSIIALFVLGTIFTALEKKKKVKIYKTMQ